MVRDISGCLEVGVELLRIKGWRIREGTGCRHQLSLPSQWKQPFQGLWGCKNLP